MLCSNLELKSWHPPLFRYPFLYTDTTCMWKFVLFISKGHFYWIDVKYAFTFLFFDNSNRNDRCLSPLMLWVRIPLRARWTALCDKVFSDKTGQLRYNWYIVESGVTYHNTNQPIEILCAFYLFHEMFLKNARGWRGVS